MTRHFLVVGHVIVDVLDFNHRPVVRLGGIFHAARAFAALGQRFSLAYIAPAYLDRQIEEHTQALGGESAMKIGDVVGCPNLVFAREPTEAGDQGYEYILEKERRVVFCEKTMKTLSLKKFDDALVFPEDADLHPILRMLKSLTAHVHLDANFVSSIPLLSKHLGRKIRTLILSTSSKVVSGQVGRDLHKVAMLGLKIAERVMIKENRGGSRLWINGKRKPVSAPAFLSQTVHSVGVGDCFNGIYVSSLRRNSHETALRRASVMAADYAATLDEAEFFGAASTSAKISDIDLRELQGVSVPWEKRPSVHIYLAAPDFQNVNISALEVVEKALLYHNFTPHRPVKEHGEVNSSASPSTRLKAASADMELLRECQIVIAVPIYADPGTYIEIGSALEMGKPVLVYAPHGMPPNLLAEELPTLVTDKLEDLMAQVFCEAHKVLAV